MAVTIGDITELRVRRRGVGWEMVAVIVRKRDEAGEIQDTTTLSRPLTFGQQSAIEQFLTTHVLGRLNAAQGP